MTFYKYTGPVGPPVDVLVGGKLVRSDVNGVIELADDIEISSRLFEQVDGNKTEETSTDEDSANTNEEE